MRWQLVLVGAFASAYLLAGSACTYAQSSRSTAVNAICPPLPSTEDQHHSGSRISIADVTFPGSARLPISEQRKIATAIKQQVSGYSLDNVRGEALAEAKAGWQDRGYYRVQVGDTIRTLSRSPGSQRIAISIHVDEGALYRLGRITFRNNKAISDIAVLRNMIPMNDGDIFSREKMAKGIENLRATYGEIGHIDYTGVPDTNIDDEKKLINIDFDIDEGKQFYLTSINVVGLGERTRREVLKDSPTGQVYNEKLFRLFVEKHYPTLKLRYDDPRLVERHLDERTGTVTITLFACPCPVC